MRPIRVFVLFSAAALACAAAAAGAMTCHIVLDRNDNVVYRDTSPPVDLSDRGSAERAALRQRGEFLLMIEADQCSRFVATTDKAGARAVRPSIRSLRNCEAIPASVPDS